jgi:hypothetical protein
MYFQSCDLLVKNITLQLNRQGKCFFSVLKNFNRLNNYGIC